MKKKNAKLSLGMSLVEVLIASAIILAAVVTLLSVHSLYIKAAYTSGNAIKAAYLAEEALEAARFMRDSSWDGNIGSLGIGVPYGLSFEDGTWQTGTAGITIENFERVITFQPVYRDASGDIVSSGGDVDPDTLLVTARVSWKSGTSTTTKEISTYLTNFYDN